MRNTIQISATANEIVALCDDGSIWRNTTQNGWNKILPVPQDECSAVNCHKPPKTDATIIRLKDEPTQFAEVYLCDKCSSNPEILRNVPSPYINILRSAPDAQLLYNGLTIEEEQLLYNCFPIKEQP